MITGSHNPPDYNGFKMMLGKAPFYGPPIQELGEIASKGAYAVGDGTSEKIDIQDHYVERLLKDYDGGKRTDGRLGRRQRRRRRDPEAR